MTRLRKLNAYLLPLIGGGLFILAGAVTAGQLHDTWARRVAWVVGCLVAAIVFGALFPQRKDGAR